MPKLFWILVTLTITQRVFELLYSRRNQQKLAGNGYSQLESRASYSLMVLTHIGWFAAMMIEAFLSPWPLSEELSIVSFVFFMLAQALRLWVYLSLGKHWNTQVMAPDRSELSQIITNGPYRLIRHPNYLVIIIELLTLPLIGGAYLSALAFSALNIYVLSKRIAQEEEQLYKRPGYLEHFGDKPRFLPVRK